MPVAINRSSQYQPAFDLNNHIIDVPPGGKLQITKSKAMIWQEDDLQTRVWQIVYDSTENLPKYPSISYTSALNAVTGYGRQGRIIFRNLVDAGLDVHYQRVIADTQVAMHHLDLDLAALVERQDKKVTEWGIIHSVVDTIDHVPSPKRIMWSMWEADRLPGPKDRNEDAPPFEDWIGRLNRQAQACIVPATEQKRIFKESGVEIPIYVVHDSIEVDKWQYVERAAPANRPFTFFAYSFMNTRKAPIETLNCFVSAFGPNNPNVRLIMKTLGGHFGAGRGNIPNFPNITNVEIINAVWNEDQMIDFVSQHCDAGFFLSKGEGFYDPPLECLATGLPIIVVDHSGPHDYCDDRYVYTVPTKYMEPAPQNTKFMKWWIPDYDAAIAQLKEVYNNYDKALAKGKKGSAWVNKRWSTQHAKVDMMKVLNEVCK